jgi:hypothetical protein
VLHRPAFGSLSWLGQRAAHEVDMGVRVGVECRDGKKEGEAADTRQGKRQVVANQPTPMLATPDRSGRWMGARRFLLSRHAVCHAGEAIGPAVGAALASA